jgi:hypothetical protein
VRNRQRLQSAERLTPHERRFTVRPSAKTLPLLVLVLGIALGAAVLIGVVGCPSEDPVSRESTPVGVRHHDARQAAWSWLDGLEVDPVALVARGVQGKKKLAEILGAYLYLLRYSTDLSERPRLERRVRELAAQANRPEYHNMLHCDLREFNENRMSYLRVAWLLELLGQDTSFYRTQLIEMRPRLESEIARRAPNQRYRIALYYDHFGWEKPEALLASQESVLDRRLPQARYRPLAGYALAHEVSAAFQHGLRRTQDALDRDDLDYLRRVLPGLVVRFVARRNVDLVAELISAMTYLELNTLPAYQAGIAFLLGSQNPNGTWGDYEQQRATYGDGVDQKFYLHATMVTLRALLEAHEGAWLRTDTADHPGRDPGSRLLGRHQTLQVEPQATNRGGAWAGWSRRPAGAYTPVGRAAVATLSRCEAVRFRRRV